MTPARRRKAATAEQAADPTAARAAAIELLARRDFATAELRDRLERKGFESDAVAVAVAELVEERVLNDARFAANYISYEAARGHGPLRITSELQSLELPADLIAGALVGGPDWSALARAVRLRKFGPEPPADWPDTIRQARFLQYRGFSADHIRAAIGADFDLD